MSYKLGNINDGSFSSTSLSLLVYFLRNHTPESVNVNGRAEIESSLKVESSHTDLTEVTRMVLIHKNTVMVLTSSITTTSWMLSVLSNTTVTSGDVSSLLSVVVQSGRLYNQQIKNKFSANHTQGRKLRPWWNIAQIIKAIITYKHINRIVWWSDVNKPGYCSYHWRCCCRRTCFVIRWSNATSVLSISLKLEEN